MTFEFLSPLLTPVALATVEKNPRVIVILIVVLVGLLALVGLAYLIHWRTEKNNGTWPGPVPVVSRVLKERRKRRDKMRSCYQLPTSSAQPIFQKVEGIGLQFNLLLDDAKGAPFMYAADSSLRERERE
ncbi:hypothetical protein BC567DRAFT_249079 [Phyllosticta citribraziliensis]